MVINLIIKILEGTVRAVATVYSFCLHGITATTVCIIGGLLLRYGVIIIYTLCTVLL